MARRGRKTTGKAAAHARRAVIVHSLDHARMAARAAAALGVPVALRSAPGASSYAGALWFAEMIALVREEVPEADIAAVLDCADAAGDAMAGLRCGLARIRFAGRGRVRERLAALAAEYGAALDEDPAPALDLGGEGVDAEAVRAWLSIRVKTVV